QTPEAAVLYATDRATVEPTGKAPTYGYGRANRLAFGVANVSLNPQPTWKELIEQSTQAKRGREYELSLASFREVGHISPVVEQGLLSGNGYTVSTAIVTQDRGEVDQFHELLRSRLAQTSHKDVYIFVHGFNNPFEDAVFRAAEDSVLKSIVETVYEDVHV